MKIPENAVSVQLESKPVLTVDELNKDHIIGVLIDSSDGKIHIARIGNTKFKPIVAGASFWGETIFESPTAVIKYLAKANEVKAIYAFDTARDLYKWLSED